MEVWLEVLTLCYVAALKLLPIHDIVLSLLHFIFCSFGAVGFSTYIWEQSFAQPRARRREGYRIWSCISKLSLFRLLLFTRSLTTEAAQIQSSLGPVARSDARPPGIQNVAGSILRSGKTFFRGDWSWNHFCGHFFLPLIKVGQLSITSERMRTKYWLTA